MFAEPAELAARGKGAHSGVYQAAALLDGVFKELSLHVGGVVFSGQAVSRALPLTRSPEGFPQLVWDKDTVERLRIFKLDLLGVRGFEVIAPLALSRHLAGRPLGGPTAEAAPDPAHAAMSLSGRISSRPAPWAAFNWKARWPGKTC